MMFGGIFLDTDWFIIIFMEIADGLVHVLHQQLVLSARFAVNDAVQQDEKMLQIGNQQFLIVFLAQLQLLYDLFKNSFIFQRSARMNYVHIICNSVFSQNILHISSGKMKPVDFRMVYAVIIIPLFLLGTVQDHISGGDNLFCPIEIKMCFSGSNINNLIVQPSAGTVGRKLGLCK